LDINLNNMDTENKKTDIIKELDSIGFNPLINEPEGIKIKRKQLMEELKKIHRKESNRLRNEKRLKQLRNKYGSLTALEIEKRINILNKDSGMRAAKKIGELKDMAKLLIKFDGD